MTDEPSAQDREPAATGSRPKTNSRRRSASRSSVWISGGVVVVLAIATVISFRSDDQPRDSAGRPPDTAAVSPGLKPAEGAVSVGDAVPDIRFELMDGTETGFAELSGQPMVVNFFASYCTPCVTEMPDFEKVHTGIGDRVKFLGIDVSEPVEAGLKIVDQTGVTYQIGRDPTGRIMRQLGGISMPTTVFITADGKVAEIHSGQITAQRLEQMINETLLA